MALPPKSSKDKAGDRRPAAEPRKDDRKVAKNDVRNNNETDAMKEEYKRLQEKCSDNFLAIEMRFFFKFIAGEIQEA